MAIIYLLAYRSRCGLPEPWADPVDKSWFPIPIPQVRIFLSCLLLFALPLYTILSAWPMEMHTWGCGRLRKLG